MRAVIGPVEPSGVVWHAGVNRLMVVSDEGDLIMMDADGENVTGVFIGGDLEGITVADPGSRYVYVALENTNSVAEVIFGPVSRGEQRIHRVFDLSGTLGSPSNSGLEALTFAPDQNHPEGGLFYAGLQSDGSMYVFDLPIRSSTTSTTVNHITTITPLVGRTDLAGLFYLPMTGFIYALFDRSNSGRVMRPDGSFVEEWLVPGASQEGIALEADYLFIAEDRGQLWRYPLSTNLTIHLPESPGVMADRSMFISPISADQTCTLFPIQSNQIISLLAAHITTTGGFGPSTVTVTPDSQSILQYRVELDTALPQQEWTTITLTVQNSVGVVTDWCFRLAHLPCDNNGDGNVGLADVSAFVMEYNAAAPMVSLVDIDDDGSVTPDDAIRWIANYQGDTGLPVAGGTFLPPVPVCP
jgi:hypothetical protein